MEPETLPDTEAERLERGRAKARRYYWKHAEELRAKALENYYKSREGKPQRPRGRPRIEKEVAL
jgi:hypothetical protein